MRRSLAEFQVGFDGLDFFEHAKQATLNGYKASYEFLDLKGSICKTMLGSIITTRGHPLRENEFYCIATGVGYISSSRTSRLLLTFINRSYSGSFSLLQLTLTLK